jgi:hypothetical protein
MEVIKLPAEPNQKGGPPDPYPLPNPQLLTPSMEGIGKPPEPTDTSNNVGVREKDAREKAYRTLGTT